MCNTFFNMILQRLFENIKNNSLIITFAEFFIGLIVISFFFFLIRIKIKNVSIGNIEQWMSVHSTVNSELLEEIRKCCNE